MKSAVRSSSRGLRLTSIASHVALPSWLPLAIWPYPHPLAVLSTTPSASSTTSRPNTFRAKDRRSAGPRAWMCSKDPMPPHRYAAAMRYARALSVPCRIPNSVVVGQMVSSHSSAVQPQKLLPRACISRTRTFANGA